MIGQGLNNGRFPGNITKNNLIIITFSFLSGFSYVTSSLSIEGKQGNHPTIVTVDNYKPYSFVEHRHADKGLRLLAGKVHANTTLASKILSLVVHGLSVLGGER